MKNIIGVVSMGLLIAGCDQGGGDGKSGKKEDGGGSPSKDAVAPKPADDNPSPDPKPADKASKWNTTAWASARGGYALQGRVHDPVPRNPKVEWSVELDGPIIADPAIANGTVFIGSIMGTFYALDVETGEERWTFTIDDDTIESAPTIALGRVFFGGNDRFFYCLDEKTGKELWKIEGSDKFISGSLIVRSPDDSEDWVIVNGYDGISRCRRVADGSEVWSYQTDDQINSTPALVNDEAIVFGGCDMVVHAVDLKKGTMMNEVVVDAEITGTVATVGSMTYSANYANQVVAADAFGNKLTWVYEDKDFPFFASPAVNDEFVFIGSRDKHLHAIHRDSGKRAWKFKTGSRIEGSAIVFDDAVVFGSGDGRLYALAPKDGGEVWRLDLGEGIASDPAFANGRIVVGGGDGTLFCITEGKPK